MKSYILVDNEENVYFKFATDDLRTWLINHIDLSKNCAVYEFICKTK